MRVFWVVFALATLVLVVACGGESRPTTDLQATIEAAIRTAQPTPTSTPTPDIEATVQARLQAALEATPTATATAIAIPIPTATATATPVPTATATATPTASPTPTLTPTYTPLPTATPTPILAPAPTATSTPTPTPTATPEPILPVAQYVKDNNLDLSDGIVSRLEVLGENGLTKLETNFIDAIAFASLLNVYTEADQHTILDTYLDHVNDGSRYLLRQAALLNLPVETLARLEDLVTDGTFSALDSRFVRWLAERPQQSEQIIDRYTTITDAFLDVLDEGLKIGLPFDTIDFFAEKYEGDLTENRKGIMRKVAENPQLQQTNILTELLGHDDLLIRAMLEESTRYFDGDGLTIEAKSLLNDTDILFSYQPMRQVLRFDDKWSYTDIQALLEVYSTWNPYGEISKDAVNQVLDLYDVQDEQLRRLIPHAANVTFVEHAIDDNGNPITPSRITDYTEDELQWLVSYDRPVGPYEHYKAVLISDPSRIAAGSQLKDGLAKFVPLESSNNGCVWQASDENGELVSPFLKGDDIYEGDYEHVSDNPKLAIFEKLLDWGRKNMIHFGINNINVYADFGHPWGNVKGTPPEIVLAIKNEGLHAGGSHISSGLVGCMLRSRFNIPYKEGHAHDDPGVNILYPHLGHGLLEVFISDNNIVYSLGNLIYSGCFKDVPIDRLLLTTNQLDEYRRDIFKWREDYSREVNPECAALIYD